MKISCPDLQSTHWMDHIRITEPYHKIPSLKSAESLIEKFELPIPLKGFVNGTHVLVEVQITQEGIIRKDTFDVQMYNYKPLIMFNGKDTTGKWYKNLWAMEYDPSLKQYYLSDSQNDFYLNNIDNYLVWLDAVDITGLGATLEFSAQLAG